MLNSDATVIFYYFFCVGSMIKSFYFVHFNISKRSLVTADTHHSWKLGNSSVDAKNINSKIFGVSKLKLKQVLVIIHIFTKLRMQNIMIVLVNCSFLPPFRYELSNMSSICKTDISNVAKDICKVFINSERKIFVVTKNMR